MGTLPDVPNVIRSEVFYNADADTLALTRHYWRYSGGAPTGADAAALASNLVESAGSFLAPLMNVNSAVTSAQITDLSSMTGGQGGSATLTAGTASGGQIAPGSAMVI